jgi:NTE family protein
MRRISLLLGVRDARAQRRPPPRGAARQRPTGDGRLAPPRPLRVGLALGGGAARGFAHIGVIKVLEAQGIVPT